MRLQRFLTEKYHNTYKTKTFSSGPTVDVEVFVNPNRKELEEVMTNNIYQIDTFRFVIDTNKKDVYIWNADVIHDMVVGKILNINMDDFYSGQKYVDRLFTGTYEDGRTLSDSFPGDFKYGSTEKTLYMLQALRSKNFGFVTKYKLSPKSILELIDDTIEAVKKDLGNDD